MAYVILFNTGSRIKYFILTLFLFLYVDMLKQLVFQVRVTTASISCYVDYLSDTHREPMKVKAIPKSQAKIGFDTHTHVQEDNER